MAGGTNMKLSAATLKGPVVTLEPLRRRHLPGLGAAARETDIWGYMSANLADKDSLESWYAEARRFEKAAHQLPFAIRMTVEGTLIGSTRYLNIAPQHRRLEVGWTWLAPTHWGGRVNAAAKLLLATGEKPRDVSLDVSEHAAMTIMASLILNLDETITKE